MKPTYYCRDCAFFHRLPRGIGRCHRRAPLPERETVTDLPYRWPIVADDGYCGDGNPVDEPPERAR